jgi:hypothetical protein
MAAINLPRPQAPLALPRLNWWLISGLIILGMGGTLPVLQNSTSTSRGFEIRALEAEQAQLRTEISLLEADVARLTTLERIERRARELGLGPAWEPPIYVRIQEPGPEPAQVPSSRVDGGAVAQPDSSPGWQDLLSALLFWD